MLKIGITGGMGGGKSTVSKLIQLFGYPVYDSDAKARYLMEHDAGLIRDIQALFGKAVYTNNTLNAKRLASVVFSDDVQLKKLENLVHPAVQKDFEIWSSQQTAPLIFKEAAIIFETGGETFLDAVICVTAAESIRIRRVIKRDNMSEAEVRDRMKKQWPDDEKIKRSDYVIYADDQHSVINQVKDVIAALKAKL